MRIILDVNIIISALIKDSLTREIIMKSEHEFYFPLNAKEKIKKYEKLILKKSGLTSNELETISKGIFSNITLLVDKELYTHKDTATKIMAHIDSEDTIFIAAALAKKATIWSDDNHFQKQDTIQIFKTTDLVSLYKE